MSEWEEAVKGGGQESVCMCVCVCTHVCVCVCVLVLRMIKE